MATISVNCQTPVPSPDFSLGLGVDFVLPLSQEEEEQQQEQEPHQNIPEGNILEVLNLAESLTKPNQTHATTLLTLTLLPPATLTLPSRCKKTISDPNFFSDLKAFIDNVFLDQIFSRQIF